MADTCCQDKAGELAELQTRQGRVLWIALAINAILFVVEFSVGWLSRSTSLLADSLDMLGDSLVYAFSIWVLTRSNELRARAALGKGYLQLGFGLLVLGQAAWKLSTGLDVDARAMGVMAVVALAGNAWCFSLLWHHRSDDLNMRSTFLCSRNDLVANTAVIAAALLVGWSGSGWPDVIVGLSIAALFLRTSVSVIGESRRALKAAVADDSCTHTACASEEPGVAGARH